MGQPVEIYQVQQVKYNDVRALQKLIRELNEKLFEISKRLQTIEDLASE